MRGAIPPFPNTPSWCGAQLKHRDNFTLTSELDGSELSASRYGRFNPGDSPVFIEYYSKIHVIINLKQKMTGTYCYI
jgi:hypothetical protein